MTKPLAAMGVVFRAKFKPKYTREKTQRLLCGPNTRAKKRNA
jgi:hypothetical protein